MTDKPKTVFNHVNSIYVDKVPDYFGTLTQKDMSTYTLYMVNRVISMTPEYLPLVNLIQKYGTLPPDQHYKFLSGVLPRRKQYSKYIKSTGPNYPQWWIDLVANHFAVSDREAIEYIDISCKNKDLFIDMKNLVKKYGLDDKLLKEMEKYNGTT